MAVSLSPLASSFLRARPCLEEYTRDPEVRDKRAVGPSLIMHFPKKFHLEVVVMEDRVGFVQPGVMDRVDRYPFLSHSSQVKTRING